MMKQKVTQILLELETQVQMDALEKVLSAHQISMVSDFAKIAQEIKVQEKQKYQLRDEVEGLESEIEELTSQKGNLIQEVSELEAEKCHFDLSVSYKYDKN